MSGIRTSVNNPYIRNLLATGVFFVLNASLNLYLTPFYIRTIGVELYSLLPLIISVTAYFGLVTGSFNLSVSRFLSIEIRNNNYEKSNHTFNTALIGSITGVSLLLPIVVLLALYSNVIFDIPNEAQNSAPYLFLFITISFLISAIRSNFGAVPYSLNRLDIIYLIHLIELFIRFVIIFYGLKYLNKDLKWIGIAYITASLAALFLAIYFWKRLTPFLKIKLRYFKQNLLNEIFGMSGWVVINQIGSLLFLNIDLIVANKLFTATLAGIYGSILQILLYLRAFAGILTKQFTPTFYAYFAKKDIKSIIKLSNLGIESMGAVLAIPVGFIIVFSGLILELWLGQNFVQYNKLLILLVLPASINLPIRVMFSIQQAYNKVKMPGLVTLVLGLVNITLAIIFPVYLDWGLYGIAAANAIVLTAKNLFFTPWYNARILKIKMSANFNAIAKNLLFQLIFIVIGFTIKYIYPIGNLLKLVIAFIIMIGLYIPFLYILLSNEIKSKIYRFIPKIKR